MSQTWQLEWGFGTAEVQALGGMLAPLTFRLADGRSLQAMQIAPWAGTKEAAGQPGIMQRLRGDWPCVPFGGPAVPDGLPAEWQIKVPDDTWQHGYGANHEWQCIESRGDRLTIAIDYPEDLAIARLERRFVADPTGARLDVELTVHARRTVRVPIALHPTFRIPREPGRVVLEPARHGAIHTYPVPTEPGVSRVLANATADSLSRLPGVDGHPVDLSRVPLPYTTEELIFVTDIGAQEGTPQFALHYLDEQVHIGLGWDRTAMPDVMLWFSNGGRQAVPWSGRHYALGVEPVNGLFDLGRIASVPDSHPLASRTGVTFESGRPWSMRYRFSAW
ncbi:Aldose 1-epimerase [Pararobbsia alpina]|uniref:hypothetical protein n=1 Tax=Pararobbsia alpina TaxID=621374 RepID=UPI0039A5B247